MNSLRDVTTTNQASAHDAAVACRVDELSSVQDEQQPPFAVVVNRLSHGSVSGFLCSVQPMKAYLYDSKHSGAELHASHDADSTVIPFALWYGSQIRVHAAGIIHILGYECIVQMAGQQKAVAR
jgi:hypothetical protein